MYGGNGTATGGDAAANVNFNLPRVKTDPKTVAGPCLINFKPGGYEGRHLWRGTVSEEKWHQIHKVDRFPGGKGYIDPLERVLFFSDEFGEFFNKEKLTGLHLKKILEKPISWYHDSKSKGLIR